MSVASPTTTTARPHLLGEAAPRPQRLRLLPHHAGALGHDFLCYIDRLDNTIMSCFFVMVASSLAPEPEAFETVAVGHRHAFTVDAEGGFACWGDDDVLEVPAHELSDVLLAK